MPASRSHQEYIASNAYVNLNGVKWHLVLSDAVSLNEDSTIDNALSTEVVGASGYITPSITFTSVTWDVPTQRALAIAPDYNYVNSGAQTIQYQTQILVAVPSGHTRRPPQNITQSSINGASDTITITNHGYSNGDMIVIRVATGTLDTALTAGTGYGILNATANTFQLTSDGINAINLNGNSNLLQAFVIDRTVDSRGYIYTSYPFITSIGQNQAATIKFTVGCDTEL